jgi:hypothetical protein
MSIGQSAFYFIVLLLITSCAKLKTTTDYSETVSSTTYLVSGDKIYASKNYYYAEMDSTGDLFIYNCKGRKIWSLGVTGAGNKLAIQSDGNLVMYSSSNSVVWKSGTSGKGTSPYQLKMQTDGNLVLYDSTGDDLWESDTKNISYACSPPELCVSTAENSNADSEDSFYVYYNRGDDGYFSCSLYLADSNTKYCCTSKYRSSQSSKYYFDLSGGSDGALIESVSSSDGKDASRFYPGGSAKLDQMDGYLGGTCYKRFWIDMDGHGNCTYVRIHLYDYFSSSDGSCAKVYCS